MLGDFNRRLSSADAEVYREWDDGEPAGLDLHIAAEDAGARPRCDNAKYASFIDHIVLSARADAVLVPGSFAELVYAETGDAQPSDHCPVSVTLKLD